MARSCSTQQRCAVDTPGTVARRRSMHTEPTGNGPEIREVHDVTRCDGCQGILARPHAVMSWLGCKCAGTVGHRSWYCFDCGSWTYDPPHRATDPPMPMLGH